MNIAIIILLSIWSFAGTLLYLVTYSTRSLATRTSIKPWKLASHTALCGPLVIAFVLASAVNNALADSFGWFCQKYRTWLHS